MYLVRLVYCSTSIGKTDLGMVRSILESARINNERLHVTGMLCFNARYFLQVLEGRRSTVNELYQKILHDERHSKPLMISYERIEKRDFADWSMGYVGLQEHHHRLVMRHGESMEFNPYEMSPGAAYNFLLELRQQLDGKGDAGEQSTRHVA